MTSTELLATAYKMEAGGIEEGKANARLIAAAPDLLECLKKARQTLFECAQDTIGTPTEALFRAEVAQCDVVIDKAEGRPVVAPAAP